MNKYKAITATVATLATMGITTHASAATIDIDDYTGPLNVLVSPIEVSGYTISATSNLPLNSGVAEIDNNFSNLDESQAYFAGGGETHSIFRTDGLAFDFLSIEHSSSNIGTVFQGFLNGALVGEITSLTSNGLINAINTETLFFNVDLVTFDVTQGSIVIAEFEANAIAPVPLPAGGFMLLAAMAGFGALRRRN